MTLREVSVGGISLLPADDAVLGFEGAQIDFNGFSSPSAKFKKYSKYCEHLHFVLI